MYNLLPLAGILAVLGPLSHRLWWIHGEHDLLAGKYALTWLLLQAGGFFALTRIAGESFGGAAFVLTTLSLAYLVPLFTSIIVYRLFFHQLCRFPGPLAWRISKFAHVAANADRYGYKHIDQLHKQYGPIVRTGPNDLSIADPVAVMKVLGPGSKCVKAIWYDIGRPMVSMHTCRDKKEHDIRRRAWDKGFNAKALRDYEARVTSYTDLLMSQIKAFSSKALNASKWFNYYSFDVMGDLAFGESFHMLETGEKHFALPLLEAGMDPMNIIPYQPWLFYIIAQLPIISAAYWRFIKWSEEQVDKRKQMKVTEPDIMHHILEAQPMSTDPAINKHWEVGDSRLIIVAGSDTTAASLTYCAYELIKHPDILADLRTEVEPLVAGTVDYIALQKNEALNGFIDEVLRLHPPVPSGLIRIAPPEGLDIGDAHIPGGANMLLPIYTIHRSEEAFTHPNEFIPTRWHSSSDLIKNKNAFCPFSVGPFGCVGKQLAYMELRTVLAKLVTQFELAFADGEDGRRLIEKTEDHFTLQLADLFITCTPRGKT